ncbi:nitrogen regulation protein NIFR3 [Staphylococcus aureus]|nr:nitrogen regulation protein NIFR3 [Staphylococcus aureus]
MGPQHRSWRKSAYNNVQVGVGPSTQRISKRNSTGNASWGMGPNTEAVGKSAYNNVQVGGAQHKEILFL